ncbi:MAG TPA: metallophosphoesterase [Terriglobales bacterium]
MPTRRISVFFTVVLLIWTVMNVYVFWRIASIPAMSQAPHVMLALVAVLLWMSYVAARILARKKLTAIAAPLEWIGGIWLGMIFFILVCLLTTEIVTGFGYLLPRLAPTLRGYALAGAGVLSIIALVQALRAPVITVHELRLPGLPAEQDGTVVAVATDLHVGETVGVNWLSQRVDQILALKPDLIILGGDIVEGDNYGKELLAAFRRLSAPMGVFAVTGNHEFYAGVEASVRFLESANLRVLRDSWIELRPGLLLAGVDDLTARRQFGSDGNFVQKALSGRPNPAATIFLSHSPWQVEKAREAGAGLMLSGHTHGGQIWPFGYLVKMLYPFLSGKYEIGGMTLIVCRGSGTWGPRMRLWRRSEILRITLRA